MRFSQVVLERFARFVFVCFASLGSHCVCLFLFTIIDCYSFDSKQAMRARGRFKRTPSWISVAGLLIGGGGGDGWWQLSELRLFS